MPVAMEAWACLASGHTSSSLSYQHTVTKAWLCSACVANQAGWRCAQSVVPNQKVSCLARYGHQLLQGGYFYGDMVQALVVKHSWSFRVGPIAVVVIVCFAHLFGMSVPARVRSQGMWSLLCVFMLSFASGIATADLLLGDWQEIRQVPRFSNRCGRPKAARHCTLVIYNSQTCSAHRFRGCCANPQHF